MSDSAAAAGSQVARLEQIERIWSLAWDHGDLDSLDEFFSPEYRRRSSSDPEGRTLADFKHDIAETRAAFPDIRTYLEEVILGGDRAAVRWRSIGTHEHPYRGVPPTRKTVEVSGATFSRFDPAGLVVEDNVTWDPRELLGALGIIALGTD